MDQHDRTIGLSIARAAATYVGTPFRLHGRNPGIGLDCVGLVYCALREAGLKPINLSGYGLRNSSITKFMLAAHASGLRESSAPLAAGDILLAQVGPAQDHLLVAQGGIAFVHAHAGLKKVVRTQGSLPWEIARTWRACASA